MVPQVGSAEGGGRGRNCLVSTYLRPGRYLLTASTTGQSKGRGAVLLERRDVKTAEGVPPMARCSSASTRATSSSSGSRCPARRTTRSSSAAPGAQPPVPPGRLKGWPVVTVPTPCEQTLRLAKGTYLWTQLPLTVESMRRTALERVVPPVVLQGNKVHPVLFNQWYRADLGKDGKDEFSFEVPARMDVAFTLTHGMQGRLYWRRGGALKPVEVIAPQDSYTPPPPPPPEEERRRRSPLKPPSPRSPPSPRARPPRGPRARSPPSPRREEVPPRRARTRASSRARGPAQ